MLGPFPALPIFLGKNPWERGCTGTYNLTNENTRDWVLLVSLCFDKLVTLSSTSKKGGGGMFFPFFSFEDSSLHLHILPFWLL